MQKIYIIYTYTFKVLNLLINVNFTKMFFIRNFFLLFIKSSDLSFLMFLLIFIRNNNLYFDTL